MKNLFVLFYALTVFTGLTAFSESATAYVDQGEVQLNQVTVQSSELQTELDSNPVTEVQIYLPSQKKFIPMRCCRSQGCCPLLDQSCC